MQDHFKQSWDGAILNESGCDSWIVRAKLPNQRKVHGQDVIHVEGTKLFCVKLAKALKRGEDLALNDLSSNTNIVS